MTKKYVPKRLTGRCANGAERDAGYKWHAVEEASFFAKALCGAFPGGKLSNGWTTEGFDGAVGFRVTCPRCQRKLARLGCS